jgi:hypothetical protein
MVFDVIPRWFSWVILWGNMRTPHYRLPPMHWDINRNEIESGLRSWTSSIAAVKLLDYRIPRGSPGMPEDFYRSIPARPNGLPCTVHVAAGDA